MIICNGKICAKIKTGGGLAENGNPITPSVTWGEPIPCRIMANMHNKKGKANGNSFTIASYEVLVETQPFATERVTLTYDNGEELGEFSVMQIERMESVGTVKILV
jgi:hypothetical protein